MDWCNEDYVRVYTRDTADDVELPWTAMALWHAMLRRFDRSGLIEVRNGWASVARIVRMPEDIVAAAGAALEVDGRVVRVSRGFLAPNFTAAQTARKSDKARQREVRDRRRVDAASTAESSSVAALRAAELNTYATLPMNHAVVSVTSSDSQPVDNRQSCHTESHASHTASHDVTLSSALLSDPDPDPNPDALGEVAPARTAPPSQIPEVKSPPKRKRRSRIPEAWEPRPAEIEQARAAGFDLVSIAGTFKRHFSASGAPKLNWDEAFAEWIERELGYQARGRGNQRAGPGQQSVLRNLLTDIERLEQQELEKARQT